MFRKFLIFSGLIIVSAAAALAFFIVTFDADRYRLRLMEELGRAVGNPVRVGHLSLGWRGGWLEAPRPAGPYLLEDVKTQWELESESAAGHGLHRVTRRIG